MQALVRESIAAQLTLLHHRYLAACTLILLVTCMRPSELVPLVGRDRSFQNENIYQDWSPRWVGPHGPELVSMDQQAPHHVPNTSQWASIDQVRVQEIQTKLVEGLQQCRKIRQQSPGGPLPLSPALASKLSGNTRATSRGIVDKATASPLAHKRMSRIYIYIYIYICSMCSVVMTS